MDASKDPREAIKLFRVAIEPCGDIYFSSTGSYLGFSDTLNHPDMVGVNPEVGHERMTGLNLMRIQNKYFQLLTPLSASLPVAF